MEAEKTPSFSAFKFIDFERKIQISFESLISEVKLIVPQKIMSILIYMVMNSVFGKLFLKMRTIFATPHEKSPWYSIGLFSKEEFMPLKPSFGVLMRRVYFCHFGFCYSVLKYYQNKL